MNWYEVLTRMETSGGYGYDPPEPYYDWYVVKAKNVRAAKVEAVKYWRTRKNSGVNIDPRENPFKGLRATQLFPSEGQSQEEFELMMERWQKEEKER